jgi:cell division protein FtsW
MAFIDPWASPQGEGFQLIQSLYSLGDGGFFGVGLFNSRQKFLFLPFAESDFILSIIGEEIGFVGLVLLCIAYVVLIFSIIKIALNAKDRFGALLASGIAFVIAIQTMLNIAVVTGSIPPTGLPLPFISSGGTSVMVFMAAIGVVLNISKQSSAN